MAVVRLPGVTKEFTGSSMAPRVVRFRVSSILVSMQRRRQISGWLSSQQKVCSGRPHARWENIHSRLERPMYFTSGAIFPVSCPRVMASSRPLQVKAANWV